MNLQALNRICFTICIICIVAGTALSISMIWVPYENDTLMKAGSSMGVLFFASAATLIVSKLLGKARRPRDGAATKGAAPPTFWLREE